MTSGTPQTSITASAPSGGHNFRTASMTRAAGAWAISMTWSVPNFLAASSRLATPSRPITQRAPAADDIDAVQRTRRLFSGTTGARLKGIFAASVTDTIVATPQLGG